MSFCLTASADRVESRPLRDEPQRRRQILRELGPSFSLHDTDHFLVFHDTQRDWATQRGRLLEKSHDQFYTTMQQAGWPVRPLRRRLVCVLFHDRKRFSEYARSTDRLLEHWPNGYYSSSTNRIAFYNDATSAELRKFGASIQRQQNRLDQLYLRLQDTPGPAQPARRGAIEAQNQSLQRQLEGQRRQQWLIVERANAAKTTHEAVHQLAFNSGLQKRGVAYPFWMVEGLATNFESRDLNRPFGLGVDNPTRRTMLRRAAQRGELVPLGQLVVIVKPAKQSNAQRNTLYAQAWGLFRYLFERRRPQLLQLFRFHATVHGGQVGPEALRQAFADAFGPLEAVEAGWTRYVAGLKAQERR